MAEKLITNGIPLTKKGEATGTIVFADNKSDMAKISRVKDAIGYIPTLDDYIFQISEKDGIGFILERKPVMDILPMIQELNKPVIVVEMKWPEFKSKLSNPFSKIKLDGKTGEIFEIID